MSASSGIKIEKQHDRQALKFNVMKTLKIVMLMIVFSLFMTSCTDLINSDDQMIMDSIENTNAAYDTGDEHDANNGNSGRAGNGDG